MLSDFKKGFRKQGPVLEWLISKSRAYQHLGILEEHSAEDVIGEKAAVIQIKDHYHFNSFI